jgi:hypothetical protein
MIPSRLWNSGDHWLPGQLLSALAHGATNTASYSHALITLTVYTAIVTAGTLALCAKEPGALPVRATSISHARGARAESRCRR